MLKDGGQSKLSVSWALTFLQCHSLLVHFSFNSFVALYLLCHTISHVLVTMFCNEMNRSQAYQCALIMHETRQTFSDFRIPIMVLPATVSSNIPGTDYCLGTDSVLNRIMDVCLSVLSVRSTDCLMTLHVFITHAMLNLKSGGLF